MMKFTIDLMMVAHCKTIVFLVSNSPCVSVRVANPCNYEKG